MAVEPTPLVLAGVAGAFPLVGLVVAHYLRRDERASTAIERERAAVDAAHDRLVDNLERTVELLTQQNDERDKRIGLLTEQRAEDARHIAALTADRDALAAKVAATERRPTRRPG